MGLFPKPSKTFRSTVVQNKMSSCHSPCGEPAAWRGHSSLHKQQPSCSQRREPPSCNLQGLLHPGIVGQGGPLCRICTPCHNIQSDPSEAHSSDHRQGE